MTNAPESRKTHVTRILGTNKNKDVLPDIWADVERIDRSQSREKGTPGFRQGVVRIFKWRDDPSADDYLDPDVEQEIQDSNPEALKRKTKLLKVCSPDEENLNDPEEWIPIRVIKRIRSKRNSKKNNTKQEQYENLVNSELQQSRVVEQRRILHYDTNIDDKAQAAFDADPTLKAYVVKGKDYTRKDGTNDTDDTKDESQYVEHEIATKLLHRGNSVYNGNGNEPNDTGPKGRQVRRTRMKNQYLIDESEPAKLEKVGENDYNPPYRLDPFQNIINVNWTMVEEILVASALKNYDSQVTKDGVLYEEGFGRVNTAASGLGKTIAVGGRQYVVFGKPRDGAPCFIKINGDRGALIERGVLNARGDLVWSTVQSVPESSGTIALSFAGKAFFVSSSNNETTAYLYSSFDGEKWIKSTTASNPNRGEDGESGSPQGNNVAYNPETKVYCHTGSFTRAYSYFFMDLDDNFRYVNKVSETNFWSATSEDGLSWSAKYDTTKRWGGEDDPGTSGTVAVSGSSSNSIAYGGGVFAVSSSYPIVYDYYNFMGTLNVVRHSYQRIDTMGYMTSTDGRNWTNHRLPGTEYDPGIAVFDPLGLNVGNRGPTNGNAQGIIWCKTGGTDPETKKPKGFFLIIGSEESIGIRSDLSTGILILRKKRWKSTNGSKWTLVFTLSDVADHVDDALSVHKKNADPDKVIKF